MAKIFVSYSRRDIETAKALVEDLEAIGHGVSFDQELSGGQAWWDQILESVRQCDLFVFLLTSRSLDSGACKREYGYACDLGKPVLPVLASEGISTNLLPPELSRIQFVDYRSRDRDAAFRLSKALFAAPPSTPLPNPLPSPPDIPVSYLGGLSERINSTSMLSYEEQSLMILVLKRGLHTEENLEDARDLLVKLRKRKDLFAVSADEIDELFAKTREAPRKSEMHGESRTFAKAASSEEASDRPAAKSSLRKAMDVIVAISIGAAIGATVVFRSILTMKGGWIGRDVEITSLLFGSFFSAVLYLASANNRSIRILMFGYAFGVLINDGGGGANGLFIGIFLVGPFYALLAAFLGRAIGLYRAVRRGNAK